MLHQALRHPSAISKYSHHISYERLEFLGDSVLGLIVAEWLMGFYTLEKEGDLAKRHAALVCGQAISTIAKAQNLGHYLELGEGDIQQGGRHISKNLENAFEALIGAIYLDGGYKKAETFVKHHWKNLFDHMSYPPQDAKTLLQEWAQQKYKMLPIYEVVFFHGPRPFSDFFSGSSIGSHEKSKRGRSF